MQGFTYKQCIYLNPQGGRIWPAGPDFGHACPIKSVVQFTDQFQHVPKLTFVHVWWSLDHYMINGGRGKRTASL